MTSRSTLDIFIDADKPAHDVASLVGARLGVEPTLARQFADRRREEYTYEYDDVFGLLREHAYWSDEGLEFTNYRYDLTLSPVHPLDDQPWDDWARKRGLAIFDALKNLGYPLMLVVDLAVKLAEYWPGRVGDWVGAPGEMHFAFILIAWNGGLEALAQATQQVLGLQWDRRFELVRGEDANFEHPATDLYLSLRRRLEHQDWDSVGKEYPYELIMKPHYLNTRREWHEWVVTRGLRLFESLKQLDAPMVLTDGPRIKVAQWRPDAPGDDRPDHADQRKENT